MLAEKYQKRTSDILKKRLGENVKCFVFGSSLENGKFSDVDIAIDNNISEEKNIALAKEDLENSLIPYKIDLIYLKQTDKKFRNKLLTEKKI